MNRCSSTTSPSYSSTSDSTPNIYNNNPNKFSRRSKGPWSAEEDRIMTQIVETHGPRNWSMISRYIKRRPGKSCRLRWCNQQLSPTPTVEHRPSSPQEDEILIEAHIWFGSKWAAIARLLPGRTDNAVKNNWNSTLKHRYSVNGVGAVLAYATSGSVLLEDNSLTVLTLAPPGTGDGGGEKAHSTESVPVGFWDAMRHVIAREVRDYVSDSAFSDN